MANWKTKILDRMVGGISEFSLLNADLLGYLPRIWTCGTLKGLLLVFAF